ncbi:hypothetical protein D1823_02570 [Ruegeria sp. AD91A]|uniref:hypothetical protein n=1 Tax=Ruegeria sp. AD91A TaxID=2293862 RepID=UPI000E488326|nr:hypothetical protein [Ruegeria sp. AD91A]AXT25575.1 hypothetical protein D1823_02570 [Ruegeria sp. AD91A]
MGTDLQWSLAELGTRNAAPFAFVCLFLFASCATTDPELLKSELNARPTAQSASPNDYAGEVQFSISDNIPTREKSVPYTLNAGISSVTSTRLGIRGLLDLREFQVQAPALLSGTLEQSCSLNVDVKLDDTNAKGDLIELVGSVDVELYRCRDKESEGGNGRGARLISTTIGVAAAARANVRGQCVHFDLADVVLQPTGFVGGLFNLIGLTERVEEVVLTKGKEFTEENEICPKLPSELSSLKPVFDSGGTREIGDGGIGVALSGSIDTSAVTMMELLAVMQSRGIVGGEG